jgi:hypothetical protein
MTAGIPHDHFAQLRGHWVKKVAWNDDYMLRIITRQVHA